MLDLSCSSDWCWLDFADNAHDCGYDVGVSMSVVREFEALRDSGMVVMSDRERVLYYARTLGFDDLEAIAHDRDSYDDFLRNFARYADEDSW